MNIEQLHELSNIDFAKFNGHENNVKNKIIIPFLQAFGHRDLDFEHYSQGTRFDINIGGKIIIEVKALKEKLDFHIDQVEKYCSSSRAPMAILTNGKEFRIYSPLWRQPKFSDTLLYSFSTTDLANDELLNRLEEILGVKSFLSDDFNENIEKREKEIIAAKKKIEIVKRDNFETSSIIQKEIEQLREKANELEQLILSKKEIISSLNEDNNPEITRIEEEYYLIRNVVLKNKGIDSNRKALVQNNVEKKIENYSQKKILRSLLSIEHEKRDALAKGQELEDGRFIVFSGSKMSNLESPNLKSSVKKAYEDRRTLRSNGTINEARVFVKDYIFNSISLAAKVILGYSTNGNEWKEIKMQP